jgi:hypothetical protein
MSYKFSVAAFALFVVLAIAQTALASTGDEVAFRAKNGAVIVWTKRTSTLRIPYLPVAKLVNCSDEFQTCLTDRRHGFVFAYFRNCNDVDHRRLKFQPKFVSILHNHLWMVFDAAPNYMFHYEIPHGVVGIYVGPTSSFDFRLLFRDRDFRLDQLDVMEYRVIGSGTMGACRTANE